MEQQFKLPTETIELPSEGLLYPADSPLASGKVEMKYMTAKEEDILTNANFIRNNTVLDKLLQSLLVTKVNLDDLLLVDKNALLVAARILGYGKDYTFNFYNPVIGESEKVTVDLTQLEERKLDKTLIKTPGVNEFEYTLPTTGNVITFKLITHKDEREIEKEIQGMKKVNPNGSYEVTLRLKKIITSINGDRDPKAVRAFVDVMLAPDARALRKYVGEIQPEIKLTFNYESDTHTEEGVEIPITTDFFWPKS
jgi:hypothetical protein